MDKGQKIILVILAVILMAALTVLAVVLGTRKPEIIISEFQVPPFEENAVVGVPDVVSELENYREIVLEKSYAFSLDGAPMLDGNRLLVHFSSREDNQAFLLIRIYDMDNNAIGESGLLRAGEYVEAVSLSSIPTTDTVRVKILSYEPETYFSLGMASATLPIQRISN